MLPKRPNVPPHDLLFDDVAPYDEPAWKQEAHKVAEALRVGLCPKDYAFDRFLPYELQLVSDMHWTPLAVANRAAAWFYELDVRTVADIGSGAGKFCVAAALAGRCHYTGLEQRPRLVTAARALSQLFGVADRVCFIEGTLGQSTIPIADVYYFYNPFGENLFPAIEYLDECVELSSERYERDIAAAEELLRRAPVGTYVLTYNGFGGRVPSSYDEVRVARDLPNVLRMWKKTREKHRPLDFARNGPSRRTEPQSRA